ncbi:uncharacterized protein Dana_GF16871 [Drosophila ananassae]|uniref:acylphosphatase n=1 Tax=Drosophila ananassae TaxID=7217 RepID=B3LWW5_DROAN|nr:acylphosphatase-2 isoform X1 [Drosophila ananassae]EDV42753.1 uncharacterized protein Dana_GF16871 [Drosophila ananassae]
MDSKGTQTEKKSGKIRKSNQKGRITLPDEVPLHHQNEPVVTESQAESEHRPSNNEPVYSCGFEVFGIVQGVSFRMYTLRRAQKLGVRGWCMNTSQNTVRGEIEGHIRAFESMRLWLKHTGSPTSRIDKCVFTDIIESSSFKFNNFTIIVE